jgi:hypothetical protein
MKEHNGQEERRMISNILWMLYRLWKSLRFCQKLVIGILLEVVKYKIIGLKLSQLTKGILQINFNALMEKPETVPPG